MAYQDSLITSVHRKHWWKHGWELEGLSQDTPHSFSHYTLMSFEPIGRHVCYSLKLPATPSKLCLLFEDFPAVFLLHDIFIQMRSLTNAHTSQDQGRNAIRAGLHTLLLTLEEISNFTQMYLMDHELTLSPYVSMIDSYSQMAKQDETMSNLQTDKFRHI